MANKRNQCCGCKKRFIAVDMIQKPIGKFCTVDCMIEYARKPPADNAEKVRKLDKKEDNLRKKVFYANDIRLRRQVAQAVFNRYIRARDKGLDCISCGKNSGAKVNAGHYKTTKAQPQLRFNEDNCHLQCEHCNSYLSGNIEHYRPNLIKKIGRERFDKLTDYQESVKLTCEDYKQIEVKYKDKIKQLTIGEIELWQIEEH